MVYFTKKSIFLLSLCLFLTCSTLFIPKKLVHASSFTYPNMLFITEIAPHSTKVTSADAYEYIELYNNSNKSLSLRDYMIIYGYPDTIADDRYWYPEQDVVIPSQGTVVLWGINEENKHLTVANFNSHYGTSLVENSTIVKFPSSMHDARDRVLSIATRTGEVIARVRYNNGSLETSINKAIHYGIASSSSSYETKISSLGNNPSPGVVHNVQKPTSVVSIPSDTVLPTITNTTLSTIPNLMLPLTFTANASDNLMLTSVHLFYKMAGDSSFTRIPMVNTSGNSFQVELPYETFYGKATVQYYMQASDGTNLKATSTVTKQLSYTTSSFRWNQINDSTVTGINPIIVGTGTPETTTITIDGQGGQRQLSSQVRLKFEVNAVDAGKNAVTMGTNILHTFSNKTGYETITVTINPEEFTYGSSNPIAIRAGSVNQPYFPSNGETNLDDFDIRNIRLELTDGTILRDIGAYSSATTSWNLGDNGAFLPFIELNFSIPKYYWVQSLPIKKTLASTPELVFEVSGLNKGMNAVSIGNEVIYNMPFNTSGYVTLRAPIPTKYFDYHSSTPIAIRAGSVYRPYFDENPEANLDDYNLRNVRLEFPDGTVLRDPLYANASTVLPMGDDGDILPVVYFNFSIPEFKWEHRPVKKSLAQPAYMVMEVDDIDKGKNDLTIGNVTIGTIPFNLDGYSTVVFPIDPTLLTYGNKQRFALRAGNTTDAYWEHAPAAAVDDFNIRNVRLILPNGDILRDSNFVSITTVYDMGDNGTFLPILYFEYTIPEANWNSVSYPWNTNNETDGTHTIAASHTKGSLTASITSSNDGPVIVPSISSGLTYRGEFTIDAIITDSTTIEAVTTTLDGKAITLPYNTSSGELTPGSHVLKITARNILGKTNQLNISFTTPMENPTATSLSIDGETDVPLTTNLSVEANDPSGDELDVSFFKGTIYTPVSDDVKVYSFVADREPPLEMNPSGEVLLTAAEHVTMGISDSNKVTINSTEGFPYHRFEIDVDPLIGANDQVDIYWEGSTLTGRQVTLYIWHAINEKWEPLVSHAADSTNNFTLASTILAGEYVVDDQIQVLVQDLIPTRSQYDYTFVVLPDTQLYTEIYDSYFEQQIDYIIDQQSHMNIQYVAHVGDIVNTTPNLDQWQRASDHMERLELASIPYGISAGNHDVFDGGVSGVEPDYSLFNQYFGASRFENQPTYGGSYENSRARYDLISVEENDYIIMYLGWGVNDNIMAWANEILGKHPHRTAIIVTHEYMTNSGNRSATGNIIYENVVIPNSNVQLVISGHYTGSSVRSDAIDDNNDSIPDRTVHQMLADYQGISEGGSGYLKLLHFDTTNNQIYVNTYSPVLDDYNYYDTSKDEWTLSFPLIGKTKQVSTDFFKLSIKTNEQIGLTQSIQSGDTATVEYSGLDYDTSYGWYVRAVDDYSGQFSSPVYTFTTVPSSP